MNKSLRLLAVAKEFNIGKETLIEFLCSKDHEINFTNPNTKLTEEMYEAVKVEYGRGCTANGMGLDESAISGKTFYNLEFFKDMFVLIEAAEEERKRRERERARKVILDRYLHLVDAFAPDDIVKRERYIEFLIDEYLKLDKTPVRTDYNIAKLLRRNALFYLGKIKARITRNLRFAHRSIMQFLFKNMDDNSGNANVYQLANDEHFSTLNYQLCTIVKSSR